jgi:hypothetical protein
MDLLKENTWRFYVFLELLVLQLIEVFSAVLRDGRPRGRCSSPGRIKNIHFSISSRPALGPTLLSNGYWGLFSPGVKRPRREADHSLLFSAEVKCLGWLSTGETLPLPFKLLLLLLLLLYYVYFL